MSLRSSNVAVRLFTNRAEWLQSILPAVNLQHNFTSRYGCIKKVELHKHLDGSVRHQTAWELAKAKGLCGEDVTCEDFTRQCLLNEPADLTRFLQRFGVFAPPFVGDADAIYRMAYEFCEDCASENIVYCEARYSPHLLADDSLSARAVVETVNKGLQDGGRDFKIKINSILCCMRFKPEWSLEVLELCERFRDAGVVAIDLAGDENMLHETLDGHKIVFKEAARKGVHRTVHAGENGPASVVQVALDELSAERIGHGYHVLEDESLYTRLKESGVHLEVCPLSSLLTGAVPVDSYRQHPVTRFLADGASFSLNTDDTTVSGLGLSADWAICNDVFGFSHADLHTANVNAAQAAFVPEAERAALVLELEESFQKASKETATL